MEVNCMISRRLTKKMEQKEEEEEEAAGNPTKEQVIETRKDHEY